MTSGKGQAIHKVILTFPGQTVESWANRVEGTGVSPGLHAEPGCGSTEGQNRIRHQQHNCHRVTGSNQGQVAEKNHHAWIP